MSLSGSLLSAHSINPTPPRTPQSSPPESKTHLFQRVVHLAGVAVTDKLGAEQLGDQRLEQVGRHEECDARPQLEVERRNAIEKMWFCENNFVLLLRLGGRNRDSPSPCTLLCLSLSTFTPPSLILLPPLAN